MSDQIPDNPPESNERKKAVINTTSADGVDVSGVLRDATDRELVDFAAAGELGEKIREYVNGEKAGKSAEELKKELNMSDEEIKAVKDFKEGYERGSTGDTDFTGEKDQEES